MKFIYIYIYILTDGPAAQEPMGKVKNRSFEPQGNKTNDFETISIALLM